jgi:hypothetical protein
MRAPAAAPRVAIVRHTRYPYHVHVQRDALALHDAGFDVDVICDHEPGRPYYERLEGISVLRMPLHHKRDALWVRMTTDVPTVLHEIRHGRLPRCAWPRTGCSRGAPEDPGAHGPDCRREIGGDR